MGIVIAAAVLSLLICITLAFKDDNTDKYNAEPDITPAQQIAMNAVTGKQSGVSEDELNSILAYFVQQANEKELFEEGKRLLAVYIDVKEDEPCRCYFQMKYMGRELGISADANIRLNSEKRSIKMVLSDAKVGRLPISQGILRYFLDQTKLDEVSDNISINDETIKLPADFTFEVPAIGSEATLEIEKLEIYDDEIQIETNSLLSNALDGLKDEIGEKIFDFAEDYLPDDIGGYLDKFKKSE